MELDIRLLKKEDLGVVKSTAVFDELIGSLTLDGVESLISCFPKGQFCGGYSEAIVSMGLSIILSGEDVRKIKTYPVKLELLKHNSEGDTLFELGVRRFNDTESKTFRKHREALTSVCKEQNLRSVLVVTELVHYKRFADVMTVSEYVNKVSSKEFYDPLLSYQLKGFSIRRILKSPAGSEATYVLMEWNNIYFDPSM